VRLNAEHQKVRRMALLKARLTVISRMGNKIPASVLSGLSFEHITDEHCQEVHVVWRKHPSLADARITLVWQREMNKRRRKIDVSILVHGRLCGLMLARLSRRRINVTLRYLEGNPNPWRNRLKGNIMEIALIVLESFAQAYGATQISITQPDMALIPRYRQFGYRLTVRDADRERRKLPIRGDRLVR
jgi:hypothetical protein